MNKNEALEKIRELQEYIESLEKEEQSDVWVPEDGETYWYIDDLGKIYDTVLDNSYYRPKYYYDLRLSMGNVFRTEEEAQMHKLRLQSMAQRGKMPEEGEKVWFWSFPDSRPQDIEFYEAYLPNYWIGSVKKTKEEYQAWYEKFGKAWEKEER